MFKLAGSRTAAYVHYPTISVDMLSKVASRRADYNNASSVASSRVRSTAKLVYYRLFAALYGLVGRCADRVMANSTWTRGHIESLWRIPVRTSTLYPPCGGRALLALPLGGRDARILSIGQFRPEKNHALQLSSFARLVERRSRASLPAPTLVLLGGCRNAEDQARVEALRQLATTLSVDSHVEWRINVSYSALVEECGRALVGLHTMEDEHFGIGVVEYMAAGLVAIAHESAGPLMDIVVPLEGAQTGFLAKDEQQYADAMEQAFALTEERRVRMTTAARMAVKQRFIGDDKETRFSEPIFALGFLGAIGPLLDNN